MKQLILVRHAKSSWDAPLRDVDRPLTNKGIQDAHLVSSHISNQIPKSFLVWSSIAKRASETAIIFAQNIAFPIESIMFKEELYTFDERKLEQIIKLCPNDYDNLILFGHNEAICSNFFSSKVYNSSLNIMLSMGNAMFWAKIIAVSEALLAILLQTKNDFGI